MLSWGDHQSDGGNKTERGIVTIDPRGDLTLVVGDTKTRFLVCSRTLSRSADFWNRCLYGPFKEAKPAAGQDWVVKLPEDNPSGLGCLLLLAHGLERKMRKINLQLAFETTVLTDKYGMTRALLGVAQSWLKNLKPVSAHLVPYSARELPGSENTFVPQLQWIWLTRELGARDQCNMAFAELCRTMSTSGGEDSHLLLMPHPLDGNAPITRDNLQGYDNEKDIILPIADKRLISSDRERGLTSHNESTIS